MGNLKKWMLTVLLGVIALHASHGQLLSKKLVSVEFNNLTTVQALDKLNRLDSIKLSYNPDEIDQKRRTTEKFENKPISKVLDGVLGPGYEYKYRGSYIIIKKKVQTQDKKSFTFSGEITDATTGETIKDVTIYEVSNLDATLSDERGSFELTVSSKSEYVTFAISQEHYMDTLIQVRNVSELQKPVRLRPKRDTTFTQRVGIETKKLVQLFTDRTSRENARNVNLEEQRTFQFSVIPMIGTNGKLSGQVTNKYSLNLLAGYAKGVNGIEIGGLYNIDRENAIGFQVGGLGNAVGGETRGVQLAGFLNTNRGSTTGWQLAGFVNVVADSLDGTQMAGFVNVATKTASGLQASGFSNFSRDLNGVQLSGFLNIARDIEGLQGTGFLNIGRNVRGFQGAGFVNISNHLNGVQLSCINLSDSLVSGVQTGLINIVSDDVDGMQLAVVNIARDVSGVQTGILNINRDVHGMQVSGVLNVARKVNGVQLGVINIADTVERGVAIGLFNFIKNGKAEFGFEYTDVMDVNLFFRSGANHLYTVLTSGIQFHDDKLWSYGMGLGTQYRLFKRFYGNVDLTVNSINPSEELATEMNLLNRLNLNFAYRPAKHFSINAGPVLNIYTTRVYDPLSNEYGYDLGQNPFYEKLQDDIQISMWVGYAVSIRL